MRGSAGYCASIHARRCRPRRESGLASNGCQRFSTGVGTDRSSKAKGFRDVGNGQSTVLTNLCAPQLAVLALTTAPPLFVTLRCIRSVEARQLQQARTLLSAWLPTNLYRGESSTMNAHDQGQDTRSTNGDGL